MPTYTETFESGSSLATLGFTSVINCENTTGQGNGGGYGIQSSGTASQQYNSSCIKLVSAALEGSVEWDIDLSAASYSTSGATGMLVRKNVSGASAWWLVTGVGASHRDFEFNLGSYAPEYLTPWTITDAHPGVGTWATIKVEWTSSTFEVPSEENDWDGVINSDGSITVKVNGSPVLTLTNKIVFCGWGVAGGDFSYPDAGLWDKLTIGPMGRLDNINAIGTGGEVSAPEAPVLSIDPPAYSRNLVLTWPGVAGATRYYLERDSGAGFVPLIDQATADYTDRQLTAGATYSYRVKANNSGGDSPYSNTVTGTTLEGNVGVIAVQGAAGIITDFQRISANNQPFIIRFSKALSVAHEPDYGDTYGISIQSWPQEDGHAGFTYALRLEYHNGTESVFSEYTDLIVAPIIDYETYALIPPPVNPVYAIELRFQFGSEDILTNTREADGFIEVLLNGVLVLSVYDLVLRPTGNWNSIWICQGGHSSATYVKKVAEFEPGFGGWSYVPSTGDNVLYSANHLGQSATDIWYEIGGNTYPNNYWWRRQGTEDSDTGQFNSADPELRTGTDANKYIYSNIGYMYHTDLSLTWDDEPPPEPPPPTPGTLTVVKVCTSSPELDFSITAGGGLTPSSFTLHDSQSQVFTDLTAGFYSIVETVPDGWEASYAVSNNSPNTSVSVSSGESVIVTITNTPVIPPAVSAGGIYKIVPGKREDTLWLDFTSDATVDVKIPDPYIRTALIGE